MSLTAETCAKIIKAKPTLAVDGSHNDRQLSVDGLSFDPHHRQGVD